MKNEHLEEMKSLKAGDEIIVYNCDLRNDMSAIVERIEVLDEGTEDEDVQIYFTDEGLYKGEDGYYYDEETDERVQDYMGWCTACDYIGRAEYSERELVINTPVLHDPSAYPPIQAK